MTMDLEWKFRGYGLKNMPQNICYTLLSSEISGKEIVCFMKISLHYIYISLTCVDIIKHCDAGIGIFDEDLLLSHF